MRRDERKGLRAYRFDSLPSERVDALVSTRIGGKSADTYSSLNVGLRVGDSADDVLENRHLLFDSYEIPLAKSVWCKQIHRDAVTAVGSEDHGRGSLSEEGIIEGADSLITSVIDTPLCVTLADCVPVVIYDPRQHAIGLAHAGWGGTVRRICSATVRAMQDEFGSDPSDLVAAIGPSIAQGDYEVGEEVIKLASAAYGANRDQVLRPNGEGKALFDLWTANAIDLEDSGVPSSQIEIAAISTAAHLDEFYSHRIEGEKTGRFIAVARLLPKP